MPCFQSITVLMHIVQQALEVKEIIEMICIPWKVFIEMIIMSFILRIYVTFVHQSGLHQSNLNGNENRNNKANLV